MNKALSKKLEQAGRKHAKSTTLGLKDSFIKGGEFVNKHSDKQYTEKDMYQILHEGLNHFSGDESVTPTNIKKYFNTYIK
jgi:hypothetical protein